MALASLTFCFCSNAQAAGCPGCCTPAAAATTASVEAAPECCTMATAPAPVSATLDAPTLPALDTTPSGFETQAAMRVATSPRSSRMAALAIPPLLVLRI